MGHPPGCLLCVTPHPCYSSASLEAYFPSFPRKLRPRVTQLVSGEAGNVMSLARFQSQPACREAVLCKKTHEHLLGSESKHDPHGNQEFLRNRGRVGWEPEGTLALPIGTRGPGCPGEAGCLRTTSSLIIVTVIVVVTTVLWWVGCG